MVHVTDDRAFSKTEKSLELCQWFNYYCSINENLISHSNNNSLEFESFFVKPHCTVSSLPVAIQSR